MKPPFDSLHRTRCLIARLILLICVPVSIGKAAVVNNSLNDAARIAAAAAYDGKVIAVNADYPAGATYAAGSVAASGTVVNDRWILTSRHFIMQMLPFDSTFSISTGINFKSSPGVVLSIESWVLNPNPDIDLALMKVVGVITGAIDAVFASPVTNELNFFVGYGIKVDLSDNSQIYSGDRRLFTSVVDDEVVASTSPFVFESTFSSISHDLLAGKAWSFDSGGGVFDSFGRQTGTMLYQGGGLGYGVTGAQDLGVPSVQAWISQTVPEPETASMLALGAALILFRRRTSPNGQGLASARSRSASNG